MGQIMTQVEKVTISDCGKALDEIERQIAHLTFEKLSIERKIQALKTQGLIISNLMRLL